MSLYPIPSHGPARVEFFQKRMDELRASLNGVVITDQTPDSEIKAIGKVLTQWQTARAERDRSDALGWLGTFAENTASKADPHVADVSKILFAEA